MCLQNFDATKETVPDFINFCKRLENLESLEGGTDRQEKKNAKDRPQVKRNAFMAMTSKMTVLKQKGALLCPTWQHGR